MFAPHRRRRCTSRRPGTGRALFLIAAFAFMMLASVAGNVATANQVATEEVAQEEIAPEATVTDIPTEESQDLVAPTEVPTEEPGDPFSIVIDKWVCDDPATAPYGSTMHDDYLAACDTPFSATFSASDGNGYQDTRTGSIINFLTPANLITVSESVPAGYGEPAVFCAEAVNFQAMAKPYASGATIQVQGKADEAIHCDWFNVILPEPPSDDPSDLYIHKWECPAGYDETLPTADPILDCTTPQNGVTFTLDHPDPNELDQQSMTGDSIPGAVYFGGIEPGPYTIVETLPPGWDHGFLWECTDSQDNFLVSMASGESHMIDIPAGEQINCKWFNVPVDPDPVHYADLTIYKYTCPAGYDRSAPGADPWIDCPSTTDGIEFTLSDDDPNTADMTSTTGNPSTGMAYFGNLPVGNFTVTETMPAGTDYVFIDHCIGLIDGVQRTYPLMIDGSFDFSVVGNDGHLTCHWYNVPLGEPENVDLYIYKFTCPAGYNVNAPGAYPMVDCANATNGINFTLTDDDPNTVDLMTMTGDSVDGAVYFGGLAPGNYTAIETVPAGIASVFVLDCVGYMDGVQRPVPFSTGPTLDLEITGYEGTITCYWFNVPQHHQGHMTLIKYSCWTEEFVSEVDCEIYEAGQTFDLLAWNGSGWSVVDTRTTSAAGTIAWSNLPGGSYVIDEHDGEPCHITASHQDGSDHILVTPGVETVVKVYNCGQPQQWETPTKYPNTGVGPVEGVMSGPSTTLPALTPLAALLSLLMARGIPPRISSRQATANADAPVSWHDGTYRYPMVAPMTNALRRTIW
jgi:uncharacterized protein YodC (DUF2158 family)